MFSLFSLRFLLEVSFSILHDLEYISEFGADQKNWTNYEGLAKRKITLGSSGDRQADGISATAGLVCMIFIETLRNLVNC
jgi:hypothetical protein